ncbi:MAG: 3-deoxy-manno-octulosonate cytidylyltransferase [Vampirovibrionales bacterium]|nr:3-deoxy-manno-octulosonate cytidylyltransferase [Vampirovibrionales bacterium]
MSKMPSILTVIPARYAASRLPGKPLADIAGKPMIVRVLERVLQIPELNQRGPIVIACDDARIQAAVEQAGGTAELTSPHHASGSDRVWEVVERRAQNGEHYDWILNIQGDEPLLSPEDVNTLLKRAAATPAWDAFTLAAPLEDPEAFTNPNVVKVVFDDNKRVLYCSRAPIPFDRSQKNGERGPLEHIYRHIGLYLYKPEALKRFTQSPASILEQLEQLEQLRLLALGLSLHCATVPNAAPGVDTPDDLARASELFVNLGL